MKIPWREGERRLYPESMVLGIVAIPEGRQTTSHGEIQQPHQVVFPAEQTRRQRGAGSGKRMEIQPVASIRKVWRQTIEAGEDLGEHRTVLVTGSGVQILSWSILKCYTQYANKFGKLSFGHRTGKGQFSFQSQRKAMPKSVQTTTC